MTGSASRYRSIAAILCLVLGIALAPLSIAGLWAVKNVTNTDGFTALLAPLSSNQGLRDDVASMISDSLSDQLQVEEFIGAIPGSSWLPDAISPQQLAERVDSTINQSVSKVIGSQQFASLWETAVRSSHAKTVSVLSDQSNSVALDEAGVLTFQLDSILDEIRTPLVQWGVPAVTTLLNINLNWDLRVIQSDALPAIQTAYQLITAFGPWLIYVSAALLLAGLLLESRYATRAFVSLAVVLGLCVLAMNTFLLEFAKGSLFANLRPDVAKSVYDQVLGSLVGAMTTTAVVALIIGVAFWPLSSWMRRRRSHAQEHVSY